jgi:hypothetical protein
MGELEQRTAEIDEAMGLDAGVMHDWDAISSMLDKLSYQIRVMRDLAANFIHESETP